jgi:hypothetical protein
MESRQAIKPDKYVKDSRGIIWAVVRDGGMVTTADEIGILSAGIQWLERAYGPLEVLDDNYFSVRQDNHSMEKN